MMAFRYKALSRDGVTESGIVEAYDEFEAVAQIKERCPTILKIEEVAVSAREPVNLNEPMWVSDKTLSMTASQFAILLRAGMPIARTVEIVAEQSADKLMKRYLIETAKDVYAGYSLSQSLETRGKKIPMTFIETVRAGEESGTLDISFERLTKYYEKSYKIKGKVRGAMMYPALLVVLSVIVIAIVCTVTIPIVSELILSTGGELPLPTRILLGMTNFFSRQWPLLLVLLVCVIVWRILWGKTENGRTFFSKLALRIPVLGKINIMNAAAQFANTMSTLLDSGLPTTRALSVTGKVMDNYVTGLAVSACTLGIEEGKSLGVVLQSVTQLPPLLREMASVGEESGSLPETLSTIGSYYDSEVEQASARALGMLEPVMTLILGVVIGFIVIALYMPMFSMYGGIA